MQSGIVHTNTKAMLQAWQRMSKSDWSKHEGPSVDEFPGLLSRLFVMEQARTNILPIRVTGDTLTDLLGPNLAGTNFLDLWGRADGLLISALLAGLLEKRKPGIIRAFGKTSEDRRLDVEISIAPLQKVQRGGPRFLCLYQTLGGEPMLKGQNVVTHHIRSLYPPETDHVRAAQSAKPAPPNLRLVPSSTH